MTFQRYFEKEYGAVNPGSVTWNHAVNSIARLTESLSGPAMAIESDICFSPSERIPVAAHPPRTTSDLTFNGLLRRMTHSRKALKLDLKEPGIVDVCLQGLREISLPQPIFLNADILQGNGGAVPRFEPEAFIALCGRLYPQGLLSLGWTTVRDPAKPYTRANVDKMLWLVRDIKAVTFPVRACLVRESWTELQRLLTTPDRSLTIWSGDSMAAEDLDWLRKNTDPRRTFYDLVDVNKRTILL